MNTKDNLKATILKNLEAISADSAWEAFVDAPDLWLSLESEEAVRAAREIADEPTGCVIPQPTQRQVSEAVRRFMQSHPVPKSAEGALREEWAELLTNELNPKNISKFSFSVYTGITRAVAFNGSLGGPYDLNLRSGRWGSSWGGSTVGEVADVTLSGTIPARQLEEAMRILNEQLKLIMGAAIAVDLARLGVAEKDLSAQAYEASLKVDGTESRQEFLDREVNWLVERCVFGVFPPFDDLERRRRESEMRKGSPTSACVS